MALVSGGRSSLNPNAPLFIPSYVRQVEDFSPEWWDLVTTSTWFREYWLSEHQGEEEGEEDIIKGLLPDNIDLDVDEDILNMEAQYEEFLEFSEAETYGGKMNAFAVIKSLNTTPKERVVKSPREAMKHWDKPAKIVSPRCSPRFIQQPR